MIEMENLALVIELKRRQGTDEQWAAETRQIILENQLSLNAPYFMLALLDRFYLWIRKETLEAISPDYVVDSEEVLAPYLQRFDVDLKDLTRSGFELIVTTWLDELVNSQTLDVSSYDWSIASGLLERVQQGRVVVGDIA